MHGAKHARQFIEFFRTQRLSAVGPGMGRVIVDFDLQTVRPGGNGRQCHGRDQEVFPGCMAGVDDDGQMGELAQHRDAGEVQCVAGVGLEGADAAFAEDHVVVAPGHDVLGAHQQFFVGGAHAAFEEDRLVQFADCLEQVEVLHVAGADLDDVHVFEE